MSKKFFLGVDGGGTKTTAVVIDGQGKILGKGKAGSTNYHNVGEEGAKKNLERVAQAALKKAAVSNLSYGVLGLAGSDTKKDTKVLTNLVANSFLGQILKENFLVLNDTQIGFYSGTRPPGVVIVAGTGCNVYGQNSEGAEAWAGDWGHLLGDQGSAFRMGLLVLETALKSFDGRIKKSLLEDLVFKEIGDSQDLLSWAYREPFEVEKVASLAPLVEKAARKGDVAAAEIIKKTAFELSLGVKAVTTKLGLSGASFKIVLLGSVFTIKIILIEELKREIACFAPKAECIFPKVEPAIGAAFLAREKYGQIYS